MSALDVLGICSLPALLIGASLALGWWLARDKRPVKFKRRKRDWVTVRLVTSTGEVHIVNAPPGSTVELETNGSLFSAVRE